MTNEEFIQIIYNKKKPSLEQEKFIRSNPVMACRYAIDVLGGRWIEGEDIIRTDERAWKDYLLRLRGKAYKYGAKDKWDWILTKLDANLVEVLNSMKMSFTMQKYICEHRPDLIGKLQNLRQELKEKYSYELSLAGLDI